MYTEWDEEEIMMRIEQLVNDRTRLEVRYNELCKLVLLHFKGLKGMLSVQFSGERYVIEDCTDYGDQIDFSVMVYKAEKENTDSHRYLIPQNLEFTVKLLEYLTETDSN